MASPNFTPTPTRCDRNIIAEIAEALNETRTRIAHSLDFAEASLPNNTDSDKPTSAIEAARRFCCDLSLLVDRLADLATDLDETGAAEGGAQ